MPPAIQMEIQCLKEMIPLTRSLLDYSYPNVKIGKNINNPYDLICDTRSDPPYSNPYFGLDGPSCCNVPGRK